MPAASDWQRMSLEATLTALHARPEAVIDLAEAVLSAHVPAWRGYATWRPSQVRSHADTLSASIHAGGAPGAWHGLPVSVKDNIGLAGWPLRAGGRTAMPLDWQCDSAITACLRRAGALFTGLTSTVPFAFTSLGVSLDGEGPRNPWDTARVCGGSSSGAAVSVVEGSAWLALGSDTAGSVRVPAAMTGVVGLKLTRGRWPTAGVIPLSHTLDSLGLLARSVADLAAGLRLLDRHRLAARDLPSLSGVRLGVLRSLPREGGDPGIDSSVDQGLGELEAAGACLVDIDLPEAGEADALFRAGGVVAAELEAFLSFQLPAWRTGLEAPLDDAMRRARDLSAVRYRERLLTLHRLSRLATERFEEAGVEALVLPTTPLTPPRRDAIASPEAFDAADARILRHTAFINYLQWCALSLPVGRDAAGMPVGLQLAMPGFAESRLLGLALAVERCLGSPSQRLGAPSRPQ